MRHEHRHSHHCQAHDDERHHEPCERHGHGGDGRKRRARFFGHGELRVVLLDILTRGASHGYELIKEIEALTGGHYSPSPGVIYPTLDFLEEHAFISFSDDDAGRKKIAITPDGEAWLNDNREHLEHIRARMTARAIGHELRKNPDLKRALDNMKAVLDLRVNQSEIDADTLKRIVGVIDKAALDIAQL